MSALKSLTFAVLPKLDADPVMVRRSRTIERLEEQKKLLADPGYTRTVRSWVNDDGQRKQAEKQQRVSPWWHQTSSGSYFFVVRSGWKPIEFDKGKAAISVASMEKLPAVIDTLIAAVRAGELDQQLAQVGKVGAAKKSKAA